MLNSLANLWESVFDVGVHVLLCSLDVLLGLKKNLVHKVLVLNDLLDHFCGLIMPFNEVYDDIVT